MDLSQAFEALNKVLQLGAKGQNTRNEMIGNANGLCSAILICAAQASKRMNEALLNPDRNQKLAILMSINTSEVEAFARMNGLCGPIFAAANALQHWSSSQWANVNLGAHNEARDLFSVLGTGEAGMQRLFAQLIAAPTDLSTKSTQEIDAWITGTVAGLSITAKEVSAQTAKLAALI